jgi:NAD(P)-dependent dehydrogenase (short-subunit alcohol dehydrogenase family)
MTMRLKDKVAIVTGGASGIGEATSYAMAKEGARVVIGDINIEGARRVAEDIKKSGGKSLALKMDLSKQDEVKQMIEKTIHEFGRVDILVNNAASFNTAYQPFHERDIADWKAEIETNLIGTLLCCWWVMPYMLKQKSGRIINVAANAGKVALPMLAIYSTYKAAIPGFSRAIAKEVATEGVTVNCISPGVIRTPPMAKYMDDPELGKAFLTRTPMGRAGEPQDIANMAVFLASDDAKFITGQDYSVDGGMTA